MPSVNLYFGFDKSILTEKSERQLNSLLNALKDDELKSFRFRLAGHTCSLGSDEYNQSLSEKRAETVRNWLKAHNFPTNYLETTGFGEKKPIRDNSTEEGRRLNRRVEIRTVGVVISSKRAVHNRAGIIPFNEGQKLCDQSDYHGAADRFEEALKLFKERGDREGIRAATVFLAIVYRELGDDEKVSHYLSKYKEIENEIAGQ